MPGWFVGDHRIVLIVIYVLPLIKKEHAAAPNDHAFYHAQASKVRNKNLFIAEEKDRGNVMPCPRIGQVATFYADYRCGNLRYANRDEKRPHLTFRRDKG